MDISGDGRDDLVWSSHVTSGSGYWYYMLANSAGGFNGNRPQGAGAPNVAMLASVVMAESVVPDRYDFPVPPGEH